MSYKCPLCLTKFTKDERLERYCHEHPERLEEFYCSENEELLRKKIFCSLRSCASASRIQSGVFLRHVGCKSRNPFWDEAGKQVRIPIEEGESRGSFTLNFLSGAKQTFVQHWELGILRALPPSRREMWFPLMLLRATGERRGGKRIGALVQLAGAKSCGKTVLAMQAMDYQGYIPPERDGHALDIQHYFFSRAPEGVSQPEDFLKTLHLADHLFRNVGELYLLEGTRPEPGNVKAVFLKPAAIARRSSSRPSTSLAVQRANGRFVSLRQGVSRVAAQTVEWVLAFWRTEGHDTFNQILARDARDYWHTVAFYDTPGEAAEREHLWLDLTAVDCVAIVINGRELFSASSDEPSLRVAVQRIAKAKERGQPCVLVVTQLDLARPTKPREADDSAILDLPEPESQRSKNRPCMSEEEWKQVEILANDLNFEQPATAGRDLLAAWLKRKQTENRKQLLSDLSFLRQVFFVWTENLPAQHEPMPQDKQPTSHGLARFVCWCLKIRWEEVNKL